MEDSTLTSYPSSWSLTSRSPLIKKRLSRSDSGGSLPDNILDKRDAKGRTTFFNATKVGDLDEAKRLLNAGSDVNKGDIYRVTPLHEAVERSNLEVVEFLVSKGCDLNAKTILGQTPLMRAVLYDDVDLVRYLHKAGARLDERDCTGKTALLIGIQEGRTEACRYLMKNGCDVNIQDRLGHTAMMMALRGGKTPNFYIGRKLVKFGYDLKKDEKWMTQEELEAVNVKPNVVDKICSKLGISLKRSPSSASKKDKNES
ncbi:serine/threonine-protein phosphatase 6 regulatory ankyrin repeat subunit C-like [Saccostrea cucullata]|uniref:serine/threonine-protein phosphatase 6 regulatory ankyrin repeat subunit C-like n=1 Tax=Saccostrea cuccullata TaxID=36930 RepID=UPI002ED4C306